MADAAGVEMTDSTEHNEGMIDLNKVEGEATPKPPAPVESVSAPPPVVVPPPQPSPDTFSPDQPKHKHIGIKEYGKGGEGVRDVTGMGSFDESDTQPPHLGPRPEEVDDDWNSTITPGPRVYREMSWTRHPIVVTLVIAAVVAIFFFGSRHGFRSWGTLLGILIITSYWVYPWTRYRYNMDWESDADPIGCLYPYGWPWW